MPPDDPELAFAKHDHAGCCGAALAAADARAAGSGNRMTPVRRRTLEILLEQHKAIGAYEVLERLAADGFGRQPPVAYRALDFLVSLGLVHRINRLNAFAACMHPGQAHNPAFLICERCNLVAETPAATARAALEAQAAATGFQIGFVSIEVLGLCPQCASKDMAAA